MATTKKQQGKTDTTLRAILILGVLYTLYFAKSLLIPLVLALLLALLLSPLVTCMKNLHIPRTVSSVVLLAAFMGAMGMLGTQLIAPAKKWAEALPEYSDALTEQLETLGESLSNDAEADDEAQADSENASANSLFANLFGRAPEEVQEVTESSDLDISNRVQQAGMEAMLYLLSATPIAIIQFLTVLMLVLFLLVFGPGLFNVYIKKTPEMNGGNLQLVNNIRAELAHYVLAISIINAGLGLCTAGLLYLLGVEDALLFGVLAGLFNFAPYVGALISTSMLCIAGVVQFGMEWNALIPAVAFFVLNVTEANFFTPLVLGQRMRLNPLTLIVWLLIWGWLWGAIGVLLSVPLLVCFKLSAKQLGKFDGVVAVIESKA